MAALAGIGCMPDTIEDRAVIVRMRRRAPGETVAPYRHRRDRPPLQHLAKALCEWLASRPDDPRTGRTAHAGRGPRGRYLGTARGRRRPRRRGTGPTAHAPPS